MPIFFNVIVTGHNNAEGKLFVLAHLVFLLIVGALFIGKRRAGINILVSNSDPPSYLLYLGIIYSAYDIFFLRNFFCLFLLFLFLLCSWRLYLFFYGNLFFRLFLLFLFLLCSWRFYLFFHWNLLCFLLLYLFLVLSWRLYIFVFFVVFFF